MDTGLLAEVQWAISVDSDECTSRCEFNRLRILSFNEQPSLIVEQLRFTLAGVLPELLPFVSSLYQSVK